MKKITEIFFSITVLFSYNICSGYQIQNSTQIINFQNSPAGVIKAMSFNIRVDFILDGLNRWNFRKNKVFDLLVDNAADVIGLQEALPHQVRQIQDALLQYGHYAAGRNDGIQGGESCAIFYRKDRFVLIDSGTFWFSDTPEKPGSKDWGNRSPRICSWVRLIDKNSNKGFYVYNVHLDNSSQNSRTKSIELLVERIAERKSSDPFIVMGDFNMEMDNPAMTFFVESFRQRQTPLMLNDVKTGETTRHSFRGSSGPQIDHILTDESSIVINETIDRRRVNGRFPSDHYPVIAKILL